MLLLDLKCKPSRLYITVTLVFFFLFTLFQTVPAVATDARSKAFNQIWHLGISQSANTDGTTISHNNEIPIDQSLLEKALPYLKQIRDVNVLILSDSKITSVEGLKELVNLEWLDIRGTNVTDVSALSNLPKLRYLNLNNTQVSDVGELSGLDNLEYLFLEGTPVSDSSLKTELGELDNATRGLFEVLLNEKKPGVQLAIRSILMNDGVSIEGARELPLDEKIKVTSTWHSELDDHSKDAIAFMLVDEKCENGEPRIICEIVDDRIRNSPDYQAIGYAYVVLHPGFDFTLFLDKTGWISEQAVRKYAGSYLEQHPKPRFK